MCINSSETQRYSSSGDRENANRIAEMLKENHQDKDIEKDILIAMELDDESESMPLSPEHYHSDMSTDKDISLGSSPNPFNNSTLLKYHVKTAGLTQISVLNILGQEVKTLVDKYHETGEYEVSWNGVNKYGNILPSGLYFVRLKTVNGIKTVKISMMK